jgi:hypothetical protein
MRRNGNLVDKARAQSFDGPLRSKVVRVAGQGNRAANRADERGKGLTGLKRVLAAAEGFQNLEADVSGANSNMLRIANAKVDVADQHAAGSEDAKVVIRNKAVRRLTGHHTDELKRLSCEWRGHGRLTFVQSHGARIAGGLRSDGVRYRGGRRECMDDVCSTSS